MKCPKCGSELQTMVLRTHAGLNKGIPPIVWAWVCPNPECSRVSPEEIKRLRDQRPGL